jgi:molecular chaperone DnaJ
VELDFRFLRADPALDSELSVNRAGFGESVVNVFAERVQRNATDASGLNAGDFCAAETACDAETDTVSTHAHRSLDSLLHCTAERDTTFELKRNVFRNELCDTCSGSGAKPGTQPQTCPTCHGSGQVRTGGGFMVTVRTCPTCGGEGKIVKDKCSNCNGTGHVRRKRNVKIRIPAGIQDGVSMVKRGEGEPGMRGGPAGDLYITVSVKPHKLFQRDGYNLFLEVPLTFVQAALGAEIDIPTLGKPVKHRFPEGTQPEQQFCIRGEGVPVINGGGRRGDLYVTAQVEIPRKLTDKQKSLLREFEGSTTGNQYEKKKSFFDRLKDAFT